MIVNNLRASLKCACVCLTERQDRETTMNEGMLLRFIILSSSSCIFQIDCITMVHKFHYSEKKRKKDGNKNKISSFGYFTVMAR